MAHHTLRKEKDCLNCGAVVEQRFCQNCGQENSVNRPGFHYLFTHFFEDLVHYDSSFWKTIKQLLLKPGYVVNEFLAGKRKKFVPPVKLYIFMSFITFLLPAILPKCAHDDKPPTENTAKTKHASPGEFEGVEAAGVKGIKTVAQLDSLQQSLPASGKIDPFEYKILKHTISQLQQSPQDREFFSFAGNDSIHAVARLDSLWNAKKHKSAAARLAYLFSRKKLELAEEGKSTREINKELKESLMHNFPKVMFIYLPLFALLLWLFHGKKRWMYYDHGVFTLYYFSALFMLFSLSYLLIWLAQIINNFNVLDWIVAGTTAFIFFYAFFYFFRAHRRVYGESRAISRIKGIALFLLNFFLMIVVLIVYVATMYLNIH